MFHLDDCHLLLAGLPGPAVLRVHGNGAQEYHQQQREFIQAYLPVRSVSRPIFIQI